MENIQIFTIISSLSALGGTIFAAISAYQAKESAKQTNEIANRNEHQELNRKLEDILKITIQYPYLEHKVFTSKWNEKKGGDDIRYLRYDNYCNLLFNYIHMVYDVFHGDKTKIEDYIDIKNWIYLHEDNWKNPIDLHENIEAYDAPFRNFINSYIR